jgi:hypothetical protein
MEKMRRRWSSQEQKAELWERWKSGQSPIDIAHALEMRHSGRASFLSLPQLVIVLD